MTNITNFEDSLKESNSATLRSQWEKALHLLFDHHEIHFRDSLEAQLDFGVDASVQEIRGKTKGRKYLLDFKNIFNKFARENFLKHNRQEFLLEICHHIYTDATRTNKERTIEGWLYKTTADIIAYALIDETRTKILYVFAFDLHKIKSPNFKTELANNSLRTIYGYTEFKNGQYQVTVNYLYDRSFFEKNSEFFCKGIDMRGVQ